jgi:hypothetical protein
MQLEEFSMLEEFNSRVCTFSTTTLEMATGKISDGEQAHKQE